MITIFRFRFFRWNSSNTTDEPPSLSEPPIRSSTCTRGRNEKATRTATFFVGDVLLHNASPSLYRDVYLTTLEYRVATSRARKLVTYVPNKSSQLGTVSTVSWTRTIRILQTFEFLCRLNTARHHLVLNKVTNGNIDMPKQTPDTVYSTGRLAVSQVNEGQVLDIRHVAKTNGIVNHPIPISMEDQHGVQRSHRHV